MKKKTINKNKIRKECWNLDAAFIDWLNIHLKVFKKDAIKIVDLEFHKFNYNGEELTQLQIIDRLIQLTNDLKTTNVWDQGYTGKQDEMLDLWKLVFPAMWW